MKVLTILAIGLLLLTGKSASASGEQLSDLLESTHQLVGRMSLFEGPVGGGDTSSLGVEIEGVRIRIQDPAKRWKGHWNAGQHRLPATGQLVLRARVTGGKANFHPQLYGGQVLAAPQHYETEGEIVTIIWSVERHADERLSGLWLELQRDESSPAEVEILDFSLWAGELY